jgi:LysR family transcriptional regulator of gallate degradation
VTDVQTDSSELPVERPAARGRGEGESRATPHCPDLNVRHLRFVQIVAEAGSMTAAAQLLGRSQTAITKAVSAAERALAVELFERATSGILVTKPGAIVLGRARRINQLLTAAREEYQRLYPARRGAHIPLFSMLSSTRKLKHVVSLYETQSIEQAAAVEGVSTSAIYRTVHELEAQLSVPIFARIADGRCIAVGYGVALAQTLKLLFAELRYCLDDIAQLQGREQGQLWIGVSPSMAPLVVPAALVMLRERHPGFDVFSRVAPIHDLLADLKSGDIDVIAGGVQSCEDMLQWAHTETLINDRICIVARKDHPLARKGSVSKADFANVKWMYPPQGSPAKRVFEAFMNDLGLGEPDNFGEITSIVMQRGLLLHSDCLTFMTEQQIRLEVDCGMLAALPYPIRNSVYETGLIHRKRSDPSPPVSSFMAIMREVAKKFGG